MNSYKTLEAAQGQGSGANWPSKTGGKSGGNRTNNPPAKQ